MRLTRTTLATWCVLGVAALLVGCSSPGSLSSIADQLPGGIGLDVPPDDAELVQWEICRLRESPFQEPGTDPDLRVGFGLTDADGPFSIADHIWSLGTEGERRRQLVTDGSLVLDRFFSAGHAVPDFAPTTLDIYDHPVDIEPLRSRDTLLLALDVDDVDPLLLTDRVGRTYERFESLPRAYFDPSRDQELDLASRFLGEPISTTVRVLDVWADADVVSRARVMTQDVNRRYAELRFLDELEDWDTVRSSADLDCPTSFERGSGGWLGFEHWDQQLTIPLAVSVDADGRPYDVVVPDDVSIGYEQLGELVIPGGGVRTMDGNAVEVSVAGFANEGIRVQFHETDLVDIELILEQYAEVSSVLGVRLQVPGREVAWWDAFELAYGTGGGVGAVIAESAVQWALEIDDDTAPAQQALLEWYSRTDDNHIISDMDGVPGNDVLIYANGFGDGAFPMSRGYDADGNTVALVLWDTRYPWRLAVPDGAPPADVTSSEEQLAECLAGTREVLGDGTCRFDDFG